MSTDVVFDSLEEMARELPGIMEDDVLELGLALHQETVLFAAEEARELTPKGPARQEHQVAKGEPYSEHMRDRWFVKGGNSGTPVKVTAGEQAMRDVVKNPDEPSTVGNDAAHSAVVNKGRSRSRGKKRPGKLQGSTQAPRGITRPLEARFAANQDDIRARAIKRTEDRL